MVKTKTRKKENKPYNPIKELFFGGGLKSLDKQRTKKKKSKAK